MIKTAVRKAFERAVEQKWWELYIAIDIHGTIFPSTKDKNIQRKFLPGAKKCLQYLSSRKDMKIFLYSCSNITEYTEVSNFLFENGIINNGFGFADVKHLETEDVIKNKYSTKPYYNLLLDDKSGFNPKSDWDIVLKTIKKIPELHCPVV